MARQPSAKSILRNMKKEKKRVEPKTPIADEMFLPNLSGIASHPEASKIEGIDHSTLTNLNWAAAGHTMDADLDIGNGGGNSYSLIFTDKDNKTLEMYKKDFGGQAWILNSEGEIVLSPFGQGETRGIGFGYASSKLYLYGSGETTLHCADNFNPFTTATYNLGSSSLKWKDLYLSGIAYLDTISNPGSIKSIVTDSAPTEVSACVEETEILPNVFIPMFNFKGTVNQGGMWWALNILGDSTRTPTLFFFDTVSDISADINYDRSDDSLHFNHASGGYFFDEDVSVASKIKLTTIGGLAIALINQTGANSVAGETVKASVGTADAVDATAGGELMPIGVFLDDGIANGSTAWVVVSGIADVKADGTGWALGDRIVTSATARRAVANNAPAVAVHFQEIGHAIEAAGANALGRCVIHFL